MKTSSKLPLCLALLAAVLLAACAGTGGIEVKDAWVRSSAMMDRAGAAYLVITNGGA